MNRTNLGDLEQRIIVELATSMARNLGTHGTEPGDGRKGTLFLTFASSDVEFAASILRSLRVAMPDYYDPHITEIAKKLAEIHQRKLRN